MARFDGHWQIAVRMLAAFALVFLSFAHKPSLANVANLAVMTEYVLPDGTIADICFGNEGVDHGTGRDKPSAPVCEACRLAGSVLIPQQPEVNIVAENGGWLASTPFVTAEAPPTPFRLLPPSRGPPLLS